MINFALGFAACAVIAVLSPKAAVMIYDWTARAIAWLRGLWQGPGA